MEPAVPSTPAESAPLLAHRTAAVYQRKAASSSHIPTTRTEFIWPTSVGEWARGVGRSVYWHLMKMRLWTFLTLVTISYALLSACFAGVYFGLSSEFNPEFPSFADCYFYSGGRMVGLDGRFDAFGSAASFVSLLQAFIALVGASMLTGLLYGRFALPSSDAIMFSDNMVITQHDGKDVLMFRLANARRGKIKDLEVQVFCTVRKGDYTSVVPIQLRKSLQPSLEQYPWTVMHEIDDDSLFARDSWDAVCASMDLVLVHVKGVDMIVNSQIFAEKAYPLERIKLNMALQDMVKNTDVNTPNGHKERHQVVNYKNFHRVVPRVSERFGYMALFGGAAGGISVELN